MAERPSCFLRSGNIRFNGWTRNNSTPRSILIIICLFCSMALPDKRRLPMRNTRRNIISILFSLLAAAPVAETYAADLIDIYKEARGSDAVYASARAAWSAGQEKLPQGHAGLLPQVSLSASTQYNYILSLSKLKAATGRLAEDDLLQVNAWLER